MDGMDSYEQREVAERSYTFRARVDFDSQSLTADALTRLRQQAHDCVDQLMDELSDHA